MIKKLFLLLIIGCQLPTANCQLAHNFKQHITFLASDSLHGRMTGSKDETNSALYIEGEFLKNTGLPAMNGKYKGGNYRQPFTYNVKVHGHGEEKGKISGQNVAAFIDNHSNQTVIIGAHFDHLGMGDSSHSAYRGEPAVHNGADDNASGVAMVLELAKQIKQSSFKNNNYVFVLFSGEELGLYGSKWFAEHMKYDSTSINFMLNFDMVGRMDSNKLVVGGVGTSSAWNEAIKNISSPLHIKTTESGVGPSDHTSFYLKSIPVLHFFTGQHKDYHKPSDDESKINYAGMEETFNYIMKLIERLDAKGKISFVKTKDDTNENTPKFTVTLGVMPDYTYDGEGMRIDGITDGKPASKAELKTGDVVIQLGEVKVTDMTTYMKALSQLKKGDSTKVKVKRGSETIEHDIHF